MTQDEIAKVAGKLTEAQKSLLLVLNPQSQKRAIHFSGSVANRLCRYTEKRPALVFATLTAVGRIAWYQLLPDGIAVREFLVEQAK